MALNPVGGPFNVAPGLNPPVNPLQGQANPNQLPPAAPVNAPQQAGNPNPLQAALEPVNGQAPGVGQHPGPQLPAGVGQQLNIPG